MTPGQSSGDFGPMSEAGVGLACQECTFQTADERKADAHNALTGHTIAIDYIDRESEWPAEVKRMPCSHWPGQTRCGVCGMGLQPGEKRWYA